MTSGEAMYCLKKSHRGEPVKIRFKGMELTTITPGDIGKYGDIYSFVGLHVWLDEQENTVYSMCLKDNAGCQVVGNIKDMEVVKE